MEFSNEKAHNEEIDYENPFLSMKIYQNYRNKDDAAKWHYHKELEMLAVLDGYLDLYVENDHLRLEKGDVVLVGAYQLHRDRTYCDSKLNYIVFQFDVQQYFENSTMPYLRFFSEPSFPLHKLNYIFHECENAKKTVYESVKEILQEVKEKEEGYEIAVSMIIKRIILSLIRSDTRKMIDLKENTDLLRLKPVLDYIEKNLSAKIQVEEASRIANISYYYFVKFFKKVLGMSFLEYVNYKKIKLAERILLTKDVSVSQVAEDVGMPNMAHFYKVFKKYHNCSPNEFRKKMIDWTN